MLKRGRGSKGGTLFVLHFSIEDEKWVIALRFTSENFASLRLILLTLFFDSMMIFDYCSSRFNTMSDIQEKKDAILKKLSNAQQKNYRFKNKLII